MGYACGVFVSPGYATICPPTGGGYSSGRTLLYWEYPEIDKENILTVYRKLLGLLEDKDKARVAKIIRPFAKIKSKKEYDLEDFSINRLQENNKAILALKRIFDRFLEDIANKARIEKKRRRKEEEQIISFLITQL